MNESIVSYGRPLKPFGMRRGGVQKKFFGGFIDKLKEKASDIWDSLWNDEHLPTRFRKFVKAHGDEKISSIQVYRYPLDTLTNTLLQLVTAGNWNEIKRKGGHDALFHLGIVINGKYTVEKLEKLESREDASPLTKPEAQLMNVPITKDVTIGEMLENAKKGMGKNFYTYSALGGNNCQNFVLGLLENSKLLNSSLKEFIFQNIEKLVEATPSLTKWLAQGITDMARNVTNVTDAIIYKKGGRRKFIQ
jgi:hypothetical protein